MNLSFAHLILPTHGLGPSPTATPKNTTLCCAVVDTFRGHSAICCGADERTLHECQEDPISADIEDVVAFSSKRMQGIAILDGWATKKVAGFWSVQPVGDKYEEATVEMTDVAFTFAGGETDAAKLKTWIPHAELQQEMTVNVVPCESTPFLIGLDVLREHGMVFDHWNCVYSHVLKRSLPCATLDRASCFGDDATRMPGTAPIVLRDPLEALGLTESGKWRRHLCSSHLRAICTVTIQSRQDKGHDHAITVPYPCPLIMSVCQRAKVIF